MLCIQWPIFQEGEKPLETVYTAGCFRFRIRAKLSLLITAVFVIVTKRAFSIVHVVSLKFIHAISHLAFINPAQRCSQACIDYDLLVCLSLRYSLILWQNQSETLGKVWFFICAVELEAVTPYSIFSGVYHEHRRKCYFDPHFGWKERRKWSAIDEVQWELLFEK